MNIEEDRRSTKHTGIRRSTVQLDKQLTLDTPLASTMEALRLIETWRTQHLLG